MSASLHPLTLTHARLRRDQGDIRGAIAIVEAMIDGGRDDDDLWRLYLTLAEAVHRPHSEPQGPAEAPPELARASQLAGDFRRLLGSPPEDPRVDRLRRWLDRIRDGSG